MTKPDHAEHGAYFCPPGFTAFDVQRRIVAEGDAWSAIQYEPVHDRDVQLPQLEIAARAAHKGLWADVGAIAPWDWRHVGG